ncbi:MAG: RidA family protein [Bryobacteraceae bacterium]
MQTSVFTPDAPKPGGFYSQAVKAGAFLFIAGQLPFDLDGKMANGDAAAQTALCMRHIRTILEATGGSLANLVQVTVYVSDIGEWPSVNAAYRDCMTGVPVPPARAVVPVKELHFGAQIEIQAVAYLAEAAP